MGVGTSLLSPVCSVPLRNYIDVLGKMEEISILCTKEKLYYSLGLTTVLTIGLYFIRQWQINQSEKEDIVVIPNWIVYLPLLYGLYIVFFSSSDAQYQIASEKIMYETSGISTKKDFLALRSNEEGRTQAFRSGLTNAGLISATGLFGPFLRGL